MSFYLASCTATLAYSSLFGEASNIHLGFISMIFLAFVIFDIDETREIAVSLAISVWCLVFLKLVLWRIVPVELPPQYQATLSEGIVPSLYAISVFMVWYLNTTSDLAQINIRKLLKRLRNRDSLLNQIEEQSHIGFWEYSFETKSHWWSDSLFHMYGLNPNEPINLDALMNKHHDKAAQLSWRSVSRGESNPIAATYDFPFQTKRGETRWGRSQKRVFHANGKATKMFGITQDVTTEKMRELRLEEQNRYLQSVINSTPVALFQLKVSPGAYWTLSFISSKGADIFELSESDKEVDLRQLLKQLPEQQANSILNAYYSAVEKRSAVKWSGEITTKSNLNKWIEVIADPRPGPRNTVIWDGVIIDNSKEKQLEFKLHKQKLVSLNNAKGAALGEMAGGIAHEINNPLAIIEGFTHRLIKATQDNSLPPDEFARMTRKIHQTTSRMNRIVSGLRDFSREGARHYQLCNVSNLISDTLELCKSRFLGSNVELRNKTKKSGGMVFCNSTEISQVILNLLNNGFDAVKMLPGKNWVSIETLDQDSFVDILVSDSGAGIDPSLREKIFQPFFTTKEIGKGTGLGLSISMGIIEKHHGQLFINPDTEITQFVIRLPGASASSTPVQPAQVTS